MINDEESQNNSFFSKTFIESISVDFYVSEEDYEKAVVEVSPRGEFYYRAYPTLEEQRDAITRNVHNITGRNFSSYDDLIEKYKGDTTKFKNTEIKLTPVFKKVSIEDLGIKFTFRLKDIYDETLGYGYIDKSSVLNVNLNNSLEVSVGVKIYVPLLSMMFYQRLLRKGHLKKKSPHIILRLKCWM